MATNHAKFGKPSHQQTIKATCVHLYTKQYRYYEQRISPDRIKGLYVRRVNKRLGHVSPNTKFTPAGASLADQICTIFEPKCPFFKNSVWIETSPFVKYGKAGLFRQRAIAINCISNDRFSYNKEDSQTFAMALDRLALWHAEHRLWSLIFIFHGRIDFIRLLSMQSIKQFSGLLNSQKKWLNLHFYIA